VIKKRGNSWWVVVYTGRDPLTGKKRQKTGTARPGRRPASSKPG
jgi:Arm DNA-binding domain